MKTINKYVSTVLVSVLCCFVFMAGSALAATTVTDPTTVYANSANPQPEEIGVIKFQEQGVNSIGDGHFTIKIPENVKIAKLGGALGNAGTLTRNTTVLGSESSPKDLYVWSKGVAAGSSGLIGYRYSATSFYTVMKVFCSSANSKGLVFGSPSSLTNMVYVADYASASTTAVNQAANDTNTKVGQIYFDNTTNETVITLAAIDSNPGVAEQMFLTGLQLEPATTNDTGTVNLSVLNGRADGTSLGFGLSNDTGVTVMSLVSQAASVSGSLSTAIPSIKTEAVAKQNMGKVKVTLVDNIADADEANNSLTFTLDNGAKFHTDVAAQDTTDTITESGFTDIDNAHTSVNSSGVLVVNLGADAGAIAENSYIQVNAGTLMDASGVTAAGDINCTVTGAGDFSNVNQTVKVAEALAGGTVVSFVDNTTAGLKTLYAGRDAQSFDTNEYVLVGETAPASLFDDGSIVISLDKGAKFQTTTPVDISAHTQSPYGTGLAVDTDTVTASAASMTISVTDATTSAEGKGAFKVGDTANGWLDLTGAETGTLTMSFSGTAGASGSAECATIINATSTTAGSETIVPGQHITVPNITIQENHYGALITNGKFGLKFPSTITLDTSVTNPTVTTTPAIGSASTTKVVYDKYEDADKNIVYFKVADDSDVTSGPYTVVISGLEATVSNTTGSGAVSFVIAGDDNTAYTAATFSSNHGAKPTKETVPFGNVVSSTVPFIGDASVADGVVTQSFIPASGNIGQVGDFYIFTNDGQFYDGTAWGTTEVSSNAGAVLDETTLTYPVSALDIGVKVYVGYGVGVTDTYASMNSNGTFGIGYTVPEAFNVDPTSATIDPEADDPTATISVANGTAPYTIAVDDETVATTNVTELSAAGDFVVTGVAEGTATITVTDSSDPANSETVTITVAATVPDLAVDPAALTLEAADATGTFDVSGGTAPYTLASSAEGVATVTAELTAAGSATVTAVANGSATITVTDSSDPAKTAEVAVTVSIPVDVPSDATTNAPAEDATAEEIAEFAKTAPVQMGPASTGEGTNIGVTLNIPKYNAAVDIWVAVQMPDGTLMFVNSDGDLVVDDYTYPAYATNVTEALGVTILESFNACLPFFGDALEGTWYAYSFIAPAVEGQTIVDAIAAALYEMTYYPFTLSCGE